MAFQIKRSSSFFEKYIEKEQQILSEHKKKLEAGDPEALKKELTSQKEIIAYLKSQLEKKNNEKKDLEHRLTTIYYNVMDEDRINALIEQKRAERQIIEDIKDQIAKSNPDLPEGLWDQWVIFAELDKNPVHFWQNILEKKSAIIQ
jgi:hypothetical protein